MLRLGPGLGIPYVGPPIPTHYLSDWELANYREDGIPEDRVQDVLGWLELYRYGLRDLAALEFMPKEKMVGAHWVSSIAWTALKWVDGQARGLKVP